MVVLTRLAWACPPCAALAEPNRQMSDTPYPQDALPLPLLRLVDSVAELGAADAGCVAVTASHGGVSAGRYALAVRPVLTVFNDAGVGLRQAGVAALPLMQAAGLAACTVAHTSACIGEAQSTWATGIVSHANTAALEWGVCVGVPLQRQVGHRVMPSAPVPTEDTAAAEMARMPYTPRV